VHAEQMSMHKIIFSCSQRAEKFEFRAKIFGRTQHVLERQNGKYLPLN
jgi:hypothetical protein